MLSFVPLPPWYSPTQPPACQLILNVTKPRPFTHLAAKLLGTSSKGTLQQGWAELARTAKYVTAWSTSYPLPVQTLYSKAGKTFYCYFSLSVILTAPQAPTPNVPSLHSLLYPCILSTN